MGQLSIYDLTHYANDKKSPGSSYELFGWWELGNLLESPPRNPENRKTRVNVQSWRYKQPSAYSYNAPLLGTIGGASRAILLLDGDSGFSGTRNNIPDSVDNHGSEGGNVSFCDGHAEFVSARPDSKYIQMIYLGTDYDP